MARSSLALLLMLVAWSAGAQLIDGGDFCAQVGPTQTFDSDPFPVAWQAASDDGDCPVRFDTNQIERERTGGVGEACDNTFAVAKFNSGLSRLEAGCAIYQMTAYDSGTLGSNGWRVPGLIFNVQNPQLSHNQVYCDNLTCGTLTYVKKDGLGPLTCSTFGAVAVGNWMGVCWGVGTDTEKAVLSYNFGASDPGPPSKPGQIGDTWGVPECSFGTCPNGVCDNDDLLAGIYFGSNVVEVLGFTQADNFRLYSCSDVTGPSVNDCTLPAALPCDV